MESFALLNKERLEHGYTSNKLVTYKNYCNKMKRLYSKENNDLSILYALESNLTKFKTTGSITYLYKNLRILHKNSSSFSKLYENYIRAFISVKKNDGNVDILVDLRNSFCDYYAFLTDIYLICDNKHDFDQYKIKYQWKDIPILFETKSCLSSFLDGTFSIKDGRFNTQLTLKILNFERKLKNFNNIFEKHGFTEFEAFIKSKELFDAICTLELFLSDNFVDSKFVCNSKQSCIEIMDFLKKVIEFRNGILHEDIDLFVVPDIFLNLEPKIEEIKTNKTMKVSKLKKLLLEVVEEELKVDGKEEIMPFPPVFYDLGFDFINYTNVKTPVAKLISKLNLPKN